MVLRRSRVAALLALVVASPAVAQTATTGAWIYDRTDDFGSLDQKFRLNCGTGTVRDDEGFVLLASVPRVKSSFACTDAEAYADATGGVLRMRTRVTGPGEMARPFDPPYAPGAGSGVGRVAQADVRLDDMLAFATPFTGTVRFAYALTGERRETPGTPPAGAAPTTLTTNASLGIVWGPDDDDVVAFNAPLGVSNVTGFLDVPVVGATLPYQLYLSGFSRLRTSLATPTFAYVGEALSDFAHTLRITRLIVLDQAGNDVTGSTPFSSRVYTLDDGGMVIGGQVSAVPEPATLGLVAAGLGALAAARRRRG